MTREFEGKSSLAKEFLHHKDVPDRTVPVYGVVVHTTGRGIVDKALAKGADPLYYAASYYLDPKPYGAHYVIGWDGTILQLADDHEKMWHVGLNKKERKAFLNGNWESTVSPKFLKHWKAKWRSQYKSPSHLYPGKSINNVYVGIETVPLVFPNPDGAVPYVPEYGLFTTEQHKSIAKLSSDIAQRWKFPNGWERTGRFVGHEDVNPLRRSNKIGGWDPGARRDHPVLDWDYIYSQIFKGVLLNEEVDDSVRHGRNYSGFIGKLAEILQRLLRR